MNDDPNWLSGTEMSAWLPLAAVLQTLPQLLDSQLRRDAGMNLFEYMILAGLSESSDHSRTISELAAFASGSLSRLSHAVGRLERAGLVTRQTQAEGRRYTLVTLTEHGLGVLQDAAPGHVAEVRRLVLDPLDPDQLQAVRSISHAILKAALPGVVALLEPLPNPLEPAQARLT